MGAALGLTMMIADKQRTTAKQTLIIAEPVEVIGFQAITRHHPARRQARPPCSVAASVSIMDLGKISVAAVIVAHMVVVVTHVGRIHPGPLPDRNADVHLLQHQLQHLLRLRRRPLHGSVAASVPLMGTVKISAIVVIAVLMVVVVTLVGRIHPGPLLGPSVTWNQQCSVAVSAKLMAMEMTNVLVDIADLTVVAVSLAGKTRPKPLLDLSVAAALRSSSFEAIRLLDLFSFPCQHFKGLFLGQVEFLAYFCFLSLSIPECPTIHAPS